MCRGDTSANIHFPTTSDLPTSSPHACLTTSSTPTPPSKMRPLVLTLSALSIAAVTAYTTPLRNDLQSPMNPGPLIPSAPEDRNVGAGDLTISDILPRSRNINIFASLARDTPVFDRFESTNPSDNTTLLAPLNSAMQALPRKPWEDRPDDDSGISATRNEDKAAQNLQRFVEEHVVPLSPWKAGKENKVQTLGGHELWWEERNGKKVILPGEVVVEAVVGRVGNGEIWSLKEVVNYPTN
jgi:hypothetical protein